MSHIFISYDHIDHDFVELLCLKLKENRFQPWIDHVELKTGIDWRNSIDKAIRSSLAMVLIISPESLKSVYVTYEWAFALGCSKVLIPILYRDTKLHERLASIKYLDFTHRTLRPWPDLMEIIKSIQLNQVTN